MRQRVCDVPAQELTLSNEQGSVQIASKVVAKLVHRLHKRTRHASFTQETIVRRKTKRIEELQEISISLWLKSQRISTPIYLFILKLFIHPIF